MFVHNLFFARLTPKNPSPPPFLRAGSGKRRQDVFPAPLFAVFHTSSLLSLPQSKIKAGKVLIDPGHLQGELEGGRPLRASCRSPGVNRALQKNTHIADEHSKK
jgi:hypothetical protein